MDYDDIDYDEGYSMIDIDNNWSNSNMEYDETDFDSDSDMDNYNYNDNSSTNNWSILIGDKINQQTNKHNDSFLDRINKKLESLEATERSVIVERKNDSSVERKNDSFLDLYETRPAHILVLIYDWGCILEYNQYTRDTYLSLDDPGALAQEWSNFMCNKIYKVQNELDRDFHLYGYTDRIAIYGPRPSARRHIGKGRIAKDPRLMTSKDLVM